MTDRFQHHRGRPELRHEHPGLTITGADAYGKGGGIVDDSIGAGLTVTDSAIIGNVSQSGGGGGVSAAG